MEQYKQVLTEDTFWKIFNWNNDDIYFKGTYLQAKQYANKLNITNPEIIPVDYKQLLDKQKKIIEEKSINSPRNNSLNKINIPLLNLDFNKYIDANYARNISLSNINDSTMDNIMERIKQNAQNGNMYAVIPLCMLNNQNLIIIRLKSLGFNCKINSNNLIVDWFN
jgi:hypothetical protein